MKTLTSIYVNGNYQDAVIEHFPTEIKDGDNKIVWADKENCIAKCRQRVRDITVYVKDYEDNKKITVVTMQGSSVQELSKLITEIEKQTSEEFID